MQGAGDVWKASAFVAASDLSSHQFKFMRITGAAASGVDAKIDIGTLATDSAIVGVLINKPTAGQGASVAKLGEVKVMVSSEIAIGAVLTVAAGGLAIGAASGDFAFGRALQAATGSGQIIGMEIIPGLTPKIG